MNKQARDKIFEEYTGLVYKVAYDKYKCFRDKVFWDDLIQEGMIGLLKAINDFDFSKGATFKTYAYRRIWGSMLPYIERVERGKKRYKDFDNNVSICSFSALGDDWMNFIGSSCDDFKDIETEFGVKYILDEVEKELTKGRTTKKTFNRTMTILNLIAEGKSFVEISEVVGISNIQISVEMQRLRKRMIKRRDNIA